MNNKDKCAFPVSNPTVSSQYEGLTKREYFTAIIAKNIVKDFVWQDSITGEIHGIDYVSKVSVMVADELLNQLEK